MVADINVRGKSELHRAGCWVIPSEGHLGPDSGSYYGKGGKVR